VGYGVRYHFGNGSSTDADNASGEECDVIDFKSSRTGNSQRGIFAPLATLGQTPMNKEMRLT
jgi:hypothetical protein